MRVLPSALCVLAACAPSDRAPGPLDAEPACTQVTLGAVGEDRDPEPSGDGRLVYFASSAFGTDFDLYVKPVGSNASTRLLALPGDQRFPKPNPARPGELAFCSDHEGAWRIYVTSEGAVRPVSPPGRAAIHPSWSPDGTLLAYSAEGDGWTLHVAEPATGRITSFEDVDGLLPEWSPAGKRLVFQRMRKRDGAYASIWTLDVEDGAARNVTSVFAADDFAAINPAWSPDGRRLVFATVAASRASRGVLDDADDLWTVDADGGRPTRLTTSPAADGMPAWGADGRIYFVSNRSGSRRIWSLSADVAP
jgi:TolB protein